MKASREVAVCKNADPGKINAEESGGKNGEEKERSNDSNQLCDRQVRREKERRASHWGRSFQRRERAGHVRKVREKDKHIVSFGGKGGGEEGGV